MQIRQGFRSTIYVCTYRRKNDLRYNKYFTRELKESASLDFCYSGVIHTCVPTQVHDGIKQLYKQKCMSFRLYKLDNTHSPAV